MGFKNITPICYDWQVFTWGHRLVNPRRVTIARNLKKAGNTVLKFHCKERLNVVAIAAGMTHSTAITDDGALFYWSSSDPDLQCHQVLLYFIMFLSTTLFCQLLDTPHKQ